MMVAGRAIPILTVGYLTYELLPDKDSSARRTQEGKVGGQVKDNVDLYVGMAGQVYTGAQLGIHVAKGLSGVVFS